MTFAEFVEAQGGPDEVAKKTAGKVSRSHVTNIAARRRSLTPAVAEHLEAAFPEVPVSDWYGWTKERPQPPADRGAAEAHTQGGEV